MPYKDKAVQSAYQMAWIRRRRQEWMSENGPCVDCGSPHGLEVDHVDAKQKVTHRVWSWSEERRLAELAKCVVRCHKCHVEKTNRQGERYVTHSERHGNTRLTTDQVRELRDMRNQGVLFKDLASRFQIGVTTAKDIYYRRNWKHV